MRDGFWQASDAPGLGGEAWHDPGLGRSSVERAVALISARGEDLRASCLPCLKAPRGKASLVALCLGLCALTACGPEFSPWSAVSITLPPPIATTASASHARTAAAAVSTAPGEGSAIVSAKMRASRPDSVRESATVFASVSAAWHPETTRTRFILSPKPLCNPNVQ